MPTLVTRFDEHGAKLVKHLPTDITPFMTAVSFLGLPAVVIFLAALIAGVAWFKHVPRIAYAQAAALAALGGNTILKYAVHRTRPHTMYVGNMKIHSYSFPSGHAFGSTVFYGLLAYLAYSRLPQPWNVIIPIALVLLILLIGISRVFLGAHFPSDVAVGWLLGALSLLLIIKLIHP